MVWSVELHAYTLHFAPDDMAWPLELVARYKKRKVVGDEKRAHDFKRRPVSETLRTVQSIPPPLNSIVPTLNVRRREAALLQSIRTNTSMPKRSRLYGFPALPRRGRN